MSSSGHVAQDKAWKNKEQGEESRYVNAKEQDQLKAIRETILKKEEAKVKEAQAKPDRDFEGGFGGQEDLEDRYATTSGEH